MRDFGKRIILLLFCLIAAQTVVSADVDTLTISQIAQNGNDVSLYVSALQSDGRPVAELLAVDQFSVNIGESPALPAEDAAVFSSLDEGVSYVFCIDISKSVTEEEMQEIRAGISNFVNHSMTERDYGRIITIGAEITSVCDATQDRSALLAAAEGLDRTATMTYLYKGLSFALDGQRKSVEGMPDRAAIILFTDGMDDSDGAYNEDEVLGDIGETRVPVYAVGLKGNDAAANLTSVGTIARRSGGALYSYGDGISVLDAVQRIADVVSNSYKLHVYPEESSFGKGFLNWKVNYTSGSVTVASKIYTFPLSMDGVSFETSAAESADAVLETESAAAADDRSEPSASQTSGPELVFEQESSDVSDIGAGESEAETDSVRETTHSSVDAVGSETVSIVDRVLTFAQENLFLLVAGLLVLIALTIILVILLQGRRRRVPDGTFPSGGSDPGSEYGGGQYGVGDRTVDENMDKTIDENADAEKTIDEFWTGDDEETVDGTRDRGIRLRFEISFEGQTRTIDRTLVETLTLGRGNSADVDVVLGSKLEERKLTSRSHASILNRPDGLFVKDEGSINKTFLNGMEVYGEMPLRNGDVLQLGRASVRVHILGV